MMHDTQLFFAVWTALILLGDLPGAHAGEPAAGRESPRWTLCTADTRLTVGINADQTLSIYELCGPDGWNWTAAASPIALVSRIEFAGTPVATKWQYRDAVVDKGDGVKVAITLVNANPAMELKSVWQAYPGPGPVRHTMYMVNQSGKPVTIYEQESLDVRVVGPGKDASIWYIKNDASTPDKTGVYYDPLVKGYQKVLDVAESETTFIPYAVVDAGGERGVYVGWEWSIGRIAIACDGPAGSAAIKAGNGDRFKTDLDAGETFEVPPGVIGAYKGDLDDAANSLHKDLFNH